MQNRVYNTKAIVEAGLISGIIVILMLITGYVPVISVVGTLMLPVPVTLLYIRHGYKVAITAIVVSTVLTAMMFNPVTALLSALSFGLIGITLGYCIKKETKASTTILLLSLVSLVVSVLTIVLTIALIQKTTFTSFITKSINDMNTAMKMSSDMLKDMYKNIGMTQDQLKQLDMLTSMFSVENIMRLLGAGFIIQAFMSAYVNYVFSKAILKRFKYEMKPMTSFSRLYLDSRVGVIILLPVLIGIILMKKSIPAGEYIFYSATYIMQLVFLIIGMSVVVYFLKNKFNLQRPIIILIIVFTALNPVFSQIFFYVGLIDMLMDFRKINPNRIFGI
ncbi:YybS family protein [Clostridium omnivorum]|uniref:Membrane protein n=1 Tax=Clostridium omnivorum TaxID=1604902 RepID=A0ABQ5N5C5_9CLOT|nr:YybS family protein [Clostridium sp. E14]GLC30438.1 membrane protein [Clostridium sp. E14]